MSSEYLIETKILPCNLNFMPTLSNGHFGYTVWGDGIFVNGVYNGAAGESRRARIPNWLNIKANIVEQEVPTAPEITYKLDLKGGHFSWQQNYTDLGVIVEQRTYAHRFFNRALIYELSVKRTQVESPLLIQLSRDAGNEQSDAFIFTPHDISDRYKVIKATTRTLENEELQQQPHTIFIVFTQEFNSDIPLTLQAGKKELRYYYMLAVDSDVHVAMGELAAMQALRDSKELLLKHEQHWSEFWQNFSISVEGNLQLSQIINAGIFYLVNSLPALESNQPMGEFFGLSPTGLGRGNLDDDYEGHNFWDCEIWMLPVISQCCIGWARDLLQYRYNKLRGAQYNAKQTGYAGARYPWESAFTGAEVTNPDYPEVAELQVHISADIVLALRQHFALTNDVDWLRNIAWPITREVALYLESRLTYDEVQQNYHINDVMCPDEYHYHVNDNVYTNVVFKQALEFASEIQPICNRQDHDLAACWHEKANAIYIHYDEKLDYHPEFVGYKQTDKVKQADTILLGYPLQYAMKQSTRLNDLEHYASVTHARGPAMTWSQFSINYLDVAETAKADAYFHQSYQPYVDAAFKVWSEVQSFDGAVNFLTGIGGFLQTIINGYAGLRIKREGNISVLEIRQTRVLPDTKALTLKGIKFADAVFALHIQPAAEAKLTCLEIGAQEVWFSCDEKKHLMKKGKTITLEKLPARLVTI